MLRVGLNATALASPLTGIGNYIVHLAAALVATGEVDLRLFDGAHWGKPIAEAMTPASARTGALRRLVKPIVPFKRELVAMRRQAKFARGLRSHRIDVYHEPNYVPLASDVPFVTTIHDLSWIRHPEMHPRDRVRWLERSMLRAVERAAAILVDSEFVRGEVIASFGCAPARVHTVHLGVAPSFRPRSAEETRDRLSPLGLRHGGYVLTVGTIEPRKNVAHALDAYALLPPLLRAHFPLVIAGARGWRASGLERRLRRLHAGGTIRYLANVDSGTLPKLYSGAAVFVFPSLYEGFGLPPLEAMASGISVLVSNRASLPEIAGDAGLLLDVEAPESTARQLEALLEDCALRASWGERAARRAAQFTWAACAERTVGAYRSALEADAG